MKDVKMEVVFFLKTKSLEIPAIGKSKDKYEEESKGSDSKIETQSSTSNKRRNKSKFYK